MGWVDQGRQTHGWFGNGTSPDEEQQVDPAYRENLRSRVFGVVETAARGFLTKDPGAAQRLRDSTSALREFAPIWALGSDLPPNQFRQAFFGPQTDAVDAWSMQKAAYGLRHADSPAGIETAGQELADAAHSIAAATRPRLMADATKQIAALGSALQDFPPASGASVTPGKPLTATPVADRTHSLQLYFPDSIFIPGSPSNERFATETEKLLRSMSDAIADAASRLKGSIFEHKEPGQPTTADGYVPKTGW